MVQADPNPITRRNLISGTVASTGAVALPELPVPAAAANGVAEHMKASRQSKRGRPPVWGDKNHRTPAGHKFVCSVDEGLQARGWSRDDPKAVRWVINELRKNGLEYKKRGEDTLCVYYNRMKRRLPPLPTEEDKKDRWVSLLIQWGKETKRHPTIISAQQAREMVNRLIAVARSTGVPISINSSST
jgi:hypothetical protein